DRDGDGVADGEDNCPDRANADQRDGDRDGFGDASARTDVPLYGDSGGKTERKRPVRWLIGR
ncbi:MAG: hypothetical protein FJ125_06835, partial [Deltaproteobacteria bacterium]|nr:hypothetical protein [Deltaproteobacteria bacterium]